MKIKKCKIVLKQFFGIISLCGVLLMAGCGRQAPAEQEEAVVSEESGAGDTIDENKEHDGEEGSDMGNTETAGETGQDTGDAEVSVEVKRMAQQQRKDAENTLLLTVNDNTVKVMIPGNPDAEEAVNTFFDDRQRAYEDTILEYEKMAQEDLAFEREEEIRGYWIGYELGKKYTVKRADGQMISIVEDSYEYAGGAHPNAVRIAYNFDTRTGESLWLEDVSKDLDTMRSESAAYMEKLIQSPEYADYMVFDDYKEHLEDILTDGTWYTDEEGFHIICNEYIITPHSTGIFEFTLPYEEVDIVKDEYRLP